MKSLNTKSSEELEKEVHKGIQKVRGDLNKLQGRLSPGQLIDDAIFYPHNKGPGEVLSHLRNNPLGSAFLSLGTLLLMEDNNHTSFEKLGKAEVEKQLLYKEELKSKATLFKDSFEAKVSEIKNGLKSKIPQRSKFAAMGKNIDLGKERVKNLDSASFIALGLGLGAISGGALPASQGEEKFVDEKLGSKLEAFQKDLKEALNESSNILKDLIVQDVTKTNVKIF